MAVNPKYPNMTIFDDFWMIFGKHFSKDTFLHGEPIGESCLYVQRRAQLPFIAKRTSYASTKP
jgi:hypothetical protein